VSELSRIADVGGTQSDTLEDVSERLWEQFPVGLYISNRWRQLRQHSPREIGHPSEEVNSKGMNWQSIRSDTDRRDPTRLPNGLIGRGVDGGEKLDDVNGRVEVCESICDEFVVRCDETGVYSCDSSARCNVRDVNESTISRMRWTNRGCKAPESVSHSY
jgi:hypothetical protein